MISATTNFARARTFIRVLQANGVEYFFLSPGFRNSPLNLALESLAPEKTIRVLDERGAAFAALGKARASGKPAAVFCTSGTAAANFFPAILEAEHSHVPLIAVSADRPAELVGTGANQTMDQNRLFGTHARHFVNIADSINENNLALAWGAVSRACGLAKTAGGGPVHINFCFNEPLIPAPQLLSGLPLEAEGLPLTVPTQVGVSSAFLETLREKLAATPCLRPIFLLGSCCFSNDFLRELLNCAQSLGIPILAEAASGALGCGERSKACAIFPQFDVVEKLPPHAWPDLAFRFGPPPIHKSIEAKLLARCGGERYFVFDYPGERRLPVAQNVQIVSCDETNWVASARKLLGDKVYPQAETTRVALAELSETYLAETRDREHKANGFSEWSCWNALLENLPKQADLFLGNSMPIRDFNRLAKNCGQEYRVLHNRGLSGIDGLIASAIGAALDSGRELILVVGDLSALYDMNALLIARDHAARLCVTIVVLNNNGGEIFRVVDTKNYPERIFVLPGNPSFAPLAQAMGIKSDAVDSQSAWQKLVCKLGKAEHGVRVIECRIDPEANRKLRQR